MAVRQNSPVTDYSRSRASLCLLFPPSTFVLQDRNSSWGRRLRWKSSIDANRGIPGGHVNFDVFSWLEPSFALRLPLFLFDAQLARPRSKHAIRLCFDLSNELFLCPEVHVSWSKTNWSLNKRRSNYNLKVPLDLHHFCWKLGRRTMERRPISIQYRVILIF